MTFWSIKINIPLGSCSFCNRIYKNGAHTDELLKQSGVKVKLKKNTLLPLIKFVQIYIFFYWHLEGPGSLIPY